MEIDAVCLRIENATLMQRYDRAMAHQSLIGRELVLGQQLALNGDHSTVCEFFTFHKNKAVKCEKLCLRENHKVFFLYKAYHFVIAVQLGHSLFGVLEKWNGEQGVGIVDVAEKLLGIEAIKDTVLKELRNVVESCSSKSTVYVTVFAQGIGHFELLLSNCIISNLNFSLVLDIVRKRFDSLIKRVFRKSESQLKKDNETFIIDSIFLNALFVFDRHRYSDFPKPYLIFITDGLFNTPDISKYENSLTLLLKRDVGFSYTIWGHISCFGAVSNIPFLDFLKRRFNSADKFRDSYLISSGFLESSSSYDAQYSHGRESSLSIQTQIISYKVKEYSLNADLQQVLASRFAEGFHDCRVHHFPPFRKRYASSFLVSLEWKQDIYIDYKVLSSRAEACNLTISITVIAPYEFLRKFQQKKFHENQKNHSGDEDSSPSWSQLMQFLQLIIHADQVLLSFSSVDLSSSSLQNSRIIRGNDGTKKLGADEKKRNSNTPRMISSLLRIPLIMWRIWLDIEKIDFICKVGRRHDALPLSFVSEEKESLNVMKACLNEALSAWSSYIESGKLYIRFDNKKERGRFPEFAVAKITWITDFMGCIYLGFFGAEKQARKALTDDLRKKILWPSIFVAIEHRYINPFSISASSITAITMAHGHALFEDAKLKNYLSVVSNNGKSLSSSRPSSSGNLVSVKKSKRMSHVAEDVDNLPDSDVSEQKKQRTNESKGSSAVSEFIRQSFGMEYLFKPTNFTQLRSFMTSFEWKTTIPEGAASYSFSNIYKKITEARLSEGFLVMSMGLRYIEFFKEISVYEENGFSGSDAQYRILVQYGIIENENGLITFRLWFEPIDLSNPLFDRKYDEILQVQQQVFHSDFEIVSALSLFDSLLFKRNNLLNHLHMRSCFGNDTSEDVISIVPEIAYLMNGVPSEFIPLDSPICTNLEAQKESDRLLKYLLHDSLLSTGIVQLYSDCCYYKILNDSSLLLILSQQVKGKVLTLSEILQLRIHEIWSQYDDNIFGVVFLLCDRDFFVDQSSQRAGKKEIEEESFFDVIKREEYAFNIIHQRTFIRCVYLNILKNIDVTEDSVERALQFCEVKKFNIDISSLSALRKFLKLGFDGLGNAFYRLISKKCQTYGKSGIFVLNAFTKEADMAQKSENENASDIDYDVSPMFLRMDIGVVKDAKNNSFESANMELTPITQDASIATFLELASKIKSGQSSSFSSKVINSKIFLVLTCYTPLPYEPPEKIVRTTSASNIVNASGSFQNLHTSLSFGENDAPLNKAGHNFDLSTQKAFNEILNLQKSLNAMIADDVLFNLLRIHDVSANILSNVLNLFSSIHASSITKFTVHLSFVDELASKIFPSKLIENEVISFGRLFIDQKEIFYLKNFPRDEEYKDLWAMVMSPLHVEKFAPCWLILIPNDSEKNVTIRFHGSQLKKSERSQLQQFVTRSLLKIAFQSSQASLLRSLQQSRNCSKLLVAPQTDDPVDESGGQMDLATKGRVSRRKLKPLGSDSKMGKKPVSTDGDLISQYENEHFACPKVLSAVFPLHDRLQASLVLKTLATALSPFIVNNRSNLYVYEDKKGSVFYLKLSELAEEPIFDVAKEQQVGSKLSLDIFGLRNPGPEISKEMIMLIESKIASIIQSVMMNLLIRNPNVKLTKADYEFFRPPNLNPNICVLYRIPGFIKDINLFLILLRQNLLKYLTQLNFNFDHGSCSNCAEFCSFQSALSQQNIMHLNQTDLAFLYKFDPRINLCASIGKGLSSVFLSLYDEKANEVVQNIFTMLDLKGIDPYPCKYEFDSEFLLQLKRIGLFPVESRLGGMDWVCNSTCKNTDLSIVVEAWAIGPINSDFLLDQLSKSFKQASAEYMFESINYSIPFSLSNQIRAIEELFQFSLLQNALSVYEIQLDLPSKVQLKALCTEVQDLLNSLNGKLQIGIYTSKKSEGRFDPVYFSNLEDENLGSFKMFFQNFDEVILLGGLISHASLLSSVDLTRSESESSKDDEGVSKEMSQWSRSFSHAKKLFYDHIPSQNSKNIMFYRSSFVLVKIVKNKLIFSLYNWHKTLINFLIKSAYRIVAWIHCRSGLLDQISLLKLGLLHIGKKIPEKVQQVVATYSSESGNKVQLQKRLVPALIFQRSKLASSLDIETSEVQFEDFWNTETLEKFVEYAVPPRQIVQESSSKINEHLEVNKFLDLFQRSSKQPWFKTALLLQIRMISFSDLIRRSILLCKGNVASLKDESLKLRAHFLLTDRANSQELASVTEKQIVSALNITLSYSRVLHISRAPILFNNNLIMSQNDGFSRIIENFLQDYIEYMESVLSATLICSVSALSSQEHLEKSSEVKEMSVSNLSNESSSNLISQKLIRVFLRKIIQGFSLIIEVNFHHNFACCNFFLTDIKKIVNSNSKGSSTLNCTDNIADELAEMTKFSTATHLNSFLYDFHLRLIFLYIKSNLNFFNVQTFFEAFENQYKQVPPFSRNLCKRLKLKFHIQQISRKSKEFLNYICENSVSYGFHDASSCFQEEPFLFEIIDDKSDSDKRNFADKVSFAYFVWHSFSEEDSLCVVVDVIRIDLVNRFPFTQPHSTIAFQSITDGERLDDHVHSWNDSVEYLNNNICERVRERLHDLFRISKVNFEKDILWDRLFSRSPLAGNFDSPFNEMEFASFVNLSVKRKLQDFDPSLSEFSLINDFWEILNRQILPLFGSRAFCTSSGDTKFIILNEKLDTNLCIIITSDPYLTQTEFWLYARTHNLLQSNQANDLVSECVNCFCYILWKTLL